MASPERLKSNQIALIHVAKQQLGLADQEYRELLNEVGGVESSKDLSPIGFTLLMDRFARLGFVSDARLRNYGDRNGMATSGQVGYIRKLWADFTDGEGTDASLGKWLEGRFQVSALRMVDGKIARKAIGALINMNKRKAAKAA